MQPRILTAQDSSYPFTSVLCVLCSIATRLHGSIATTALYFPCVGNRPRGRGLASWLYHYNVDGIGFVEGYDPVQGALAPPLRLRLHVAAWTGTWALSHWFTQSFLVANNNNFINNNNNNISNTAECPGLVDASFWSCAVVSLVVYAALVHLVQSVRPGVSVPGGPRPHRMQRKPVWDNVTTTLPHANTNPNSSCSSSTLAAAAASSVLPAQHLLKTTSSTALGWRWYTGQASHVASERRFAGTGAALTGEASGRDIWVATTTTTSTTVPFAPTKTPRKVGNTAVDETRVQEMAYGGRTPGFNPSVNPNRCVDNVNVNVAALDGSTCAPLLHTHTHWNPQPQPVFFCHSIVYSCDAPLRAQLIREYLASGKTPPSAAAAVNLDQAVQKGVHFYSMLQTEDGHWSGDYGGPHFLMPGLIVAWYVMGKPVLMLHPDEIDLIQHYLKVHQQADGGWGTHVESPSTMFGTTLSYVALRLLGMDADHEVAQKGRAFIQKHGGAVMTSSWAKLYLCVLGCMDWDGHNSVPPELWLLPNWFPFHPGRMWCHSRMVYLPMGYIYGTRLVYDRAAVDPVVLALRQELYCSSSAAGGAPADDGDDDGSDRYAAIPWSKTRHMVAPVDNYSPVAWTMKAVQNMLARYESWSIFQPFKNYIRPKGLAFCIDYMAAEDLQTNFLDIGPVNKVLNMLSAFHHARGDLHHSTVMNHMMRVHDYLWVAEDGMKMKGYNGSQCWDTSFAIQAIYEANLLDEFPEVSRNVWTYLERCQILSTDVSQATVALKYESARNRRQYYRHVSQGGWPFSTSAHGWPISDCTGEGLKGVLCLLKSKCVQQGIDDGLLRPMDPKRLQDAVNVILSYQNEDGGFATYENTRGFGFYESLNPSEVFGDIMIDYSYVECSMASLTALVDFHEEYPDHRAAEIKHAVDKGRDFLKSLQRSDGSWYGSWACCL
jgi:squalene/oxidosqualene cyclase-like protein